MRVLFALWSRLTALFGRRRFDSELDEELQFHLDEATSKFLKAGLPREAARAAALRQLGNIDATRDAVLDETGVRPLHDLGRDLRLSIRQLLHRPAFSAIVILTLATCIAANSAVFSVVYSVLLAPLPFPDAGRLVRVFNSYPAEGVTRTGSSLPEYFERRESAATLQHVALYREESNTIGGTSGSRHTFALRVTPSFFDLLQIRAMHGRVLVEDDAAPGADPVVVVTYDLWQSALGARPDAINTSMMLDGTSFTIVGVLAPSFRFPTWDAQVITPLTFGQQSRDVRARHNDSFHMLARLAPGTTVEQAHAEVVALNAAALTTYPAELHQRVIAAGYTTVVRPYLDDLTRDVQQPLHLLWTGGLIVLIIGITNVATLVVLRTRQRGHELAVRAALGAGRGRLVRQLIVETSLLVAAGGALGLVGAKWALRLLTTFEIYEIPRVGDVAISATVVGWTAGSVLVAALLAGALPALAAVGRPLTRLAGAGPRQTTASPWALRLMVSGQIAFAMMLALTAGLLLSSLRHLEAVETGFDDEHVSVAAVILPGARYPSAEARRHLLQRLLDAIETAPGVEHAAAATQLPFSGNTTRVPFTSNVPGAASATPYGTTVSTRYFDAMRISLKEGRTLLPTDDHRAAPVALIDETLAKRYWPGGAVGQQFWSAAEAGTAADATTIVGVVASIQQNSLRDRDLPGAVYRPMSQASPGFVRLAVRHRTADRDWPEVVKRIRSVDAALTPFWTDTLTASIEASLLTQRAPTQLLWVFWMIGLLLGVFGVYGVLAYEFAARRREIALRVALGGSRADIIALIWRNWATLVGLGAVTGALMATGVERVIGNLMFETSLSDPAVLVAAGITLLCAAAIAAAGPVRQALRVDPALTLRQE